MENLLVLNQQSFLDLALQAYGTVEGAVAFALANDRSLTDELVSGELLQVPEYADALPNIVEAYEAFTLRPATALTDAVTAIIANDDPCNLCKCFT